MTAGKEMTEPRKSPSPVRGLISYAELQILLAIILLSLIYAVTLPDSFATSGTMLNMARVAGILLVVAIAQSFALIAGGFDISVGATMGLTSVVAATLMVSGIPIGWAIFAGILFKLNAPVELTINSSSMSSPGKEVATEPVAITILGILHNFFITSDSLFLKPFSPSTSNI